MSCKELVELVTEYLEDTLSAVDRARFKAHVAECDDCSVYLQQMRQTISLVGELTETTITVEARDKLLAAFRTWKQS